MAEEVCNVLIVLLYLCLENAEVPDDSALADPSHVISAWIWIRETQEGGQTTGRCFDGRRAPASD
ncbi:hypothetical protein EYF80_009571 [Liparis tanakae]|uniref:Secreted protein n=1 Tax=Liparis tanakae TaxID=230148 RepID=A0A4Z2IQV9_9TELE|nr:hypothetical protein EYF80_009571 [Liparis tanakae]